MGPLSLVRVTPRKDDLLAQSVERSKDNPNPSEGERAHQALLAFLNEVLASEVRIGELKRRLQRWPQFVRERGYGLTDKVWGALVFDERQMAIRTEDGGPGGPFHCAVVEEVPEQPENAVDDVWTPPNP